MGHRPVRVTLCRGSGKHTLEWFEAASRYRYQEYAAWMPNAMEFRWSGKRVLEVGGGMGTDLVQFARNGAETTDCDMSAGHLALARVKTSAFEDFPEVSFEATPRLSPSPMGTSTSFIPTASSTTAGDEAGHLRNAPGPAPGWQSNCDGVRRAPSALLAHACRRRGPKRGMLEDLSIGEIMSRTVELSSTDAKPLVKVYSAAALRPLFNDFQRVEIRKYQLTDAERPEGFLSRGPHLSWLGRVMGWNLVVKADKAVRVTREPLWTDGLGLAGHFARRPRSGLAGRSLQRGGSITRPSNFGSSRFNSRGYPGEAR